MNLLEALMAQHAQLTENEARGFILAGKVLLNDEPVTKPGTRIRSTDTIRLRGQKTFVSRAGDKLNAAISAFHFPVANRRFLDIGSSTGGFTDALLQLGAASVTAIDVGKGLLHHKLRLDARVQVIEGCDFRHLEANALRHAPEAFVADVSFTSLATMMQKAFTLLVAASRPPEGIVLFKPQFELPKSERALLEKGILTDQDRAQQLIGDFSHSMQVLRIEVIAQIPSPVKGAKGNQEYLLHLQQR